MSERIETAAIRVDRHRVVVGWDAAATRLFGWPAEQAIGSALRELLGTTETENPGTEEQSPGGHVETREVWARTRNGKRILVALTAVPGTAVPSLDADMLLLAVPRVHVDPGDVTARRLAAIVESSDDAIISKDLNGTVMSWNRAAERMFGYSADEMIGASIRIIIPEDRQGEEDRTLATIRRGERVDHFETVRRRKDGSLLTISLTVSPIRRADGQIVGASKIARDMTLLKAIEAERFRLLEESAAMTTTLNEVGASVAADLDRMSMGQVVTDAVTELTTAAFGAFFYGVVDDSGALHTLYAVSGAPREAFTVLAGERNTAVFDLTLTDAGVVRSADITQDPRFRDGSKRRVLPFAGLPVRSYLAVPVMARTGEVVGGLFLGHADVDRFTDQHERLAIGIASWASVGLENAHLYQSAQEANRIKDDFLASLSHELRTPLNAILGYARIIRTGTIPQEKHGRAIETIERNAHALTQIVEDVLDVSRIVSGKMRLNVQPIDLPEVVRAAIDAVLPAADAKGIRIGAVLDPRASPVSGDPDRLQQILWNLLTNAVKFTHRGGQVQVRLARVDSHVEIAVSDTGKGIAAEFIPHLFERFRQSETGTTREHGGLGLGLAIARQLTEMHGGTIEASSGGRGLGATFRVKLPVMIVRAAQAEQVQLRTGQPSARLASPDLRRLHVLVVDDDRDALALVSDVLEAAGARVSAAHSGVQALAMIHVDPPDVLVADLGMPQMDGFELIARIRQFENPTLRNLPAVALTAYARSEDRGKAARAGFHVHLAKPIEPLELTTTVAALATRPGANVDAADAAAPHQKGRPEVPDPLE